MASKTKTSTKICWEVYCDFSRQRHVGAKQPGGGEGLGADPDLPGARPGQAQGALVQVESWRSHRQPCHHRDLDHQPCYFGDSGNPTFIRLDLPCVSIALCIIVREMIARAIERRRLGP